MKPLDIRFNKVLTIAALVVGALLLVSSLLTAQPIGMAVGALLMLVGVLFQVNPMMRIEAHEVQVRNAIGMTLKRYPVSSPADLRLEGNTLFHVPQNKKIANLGFGTAKDSMDALRAQLSAVN